MKKTGKHLFVTVGTTKFDELCEFIYSEEILKTLTMLGFTSMTAQIGNSESEPLSGLFHGISIESYRFKPNILEDMSKSDLVISHAGAGSCLEALDLKKPLLVVVNTDLMDNHQLEIAEQLNILGHLYYCTCGTLLTTLETVDFAMLKPYHKADTTSFYSYLDRYLGFKKRL